MAVESTFANVRVAAGVLFRDASNRVLVVKPTYKAGWDIPGGYVEVGESPKAAAIREVGEELGVDAIVGALLVVDWAPSDGDGDKLLFVFDGGEGPSIKAIVRQESELADARYAEQRELEDLLPDRLWRRVAAALRGGETYLEHGSSGEAGPS